MSRGLEIAAKKKLSLYKNSLKQSATCEEIDRYKRYRNEYNKLKQTAQLTYYQNKLKDCKNNTKELWRVINRVIGKQKHKGNIISCITIDGLKNYNPIKIANEFGKFYSTLGETLASEIKPGHMSIDNYLRLIPRNNESLILKHITLPEVERIINELPNKTSHGHDNISNNLLKKLCSSISLPLCAIFNQSIIEGKFPNAMKLAEIIPLYKGKAFDKVLNYRPISLLITISKVLEKAIYIRVYKFLEKHSILYNSQYGFRSKRSCEQALIEMVGNIIQAHNRGEHSASLFLDLSKAFDTLDHSILLRK